MFIHNQSLSIQGATSDGSPTGMTRFIQMTTYLIAPPDAEMTKQLASDNFKVAERLTQLQSLLRQGQFDEIVDIWKGVNLSGGETADPPHQVYDLFQEILDADECHRRGELTA